MIINGQRNLILQMAEEFGVPNGGTTGQVLAKTSDIDKNVGWVAQSGVPDGGTTGQVLAKTSDADKSVGWVAQTPSGEGKFLPLSGGFMAENAEVSMPASGIDRLAAISNTGVNFKETLAAPAIGKNEAVVNCHGALVRASELSGGVYKQVSATNISSTGVLFNHDKLTPEAHYTGNIHLHENNLIVDAPNVNIANPSCNGLMGSAPNSLATKEYVDNAMASGFYFFTSYQATIHTSIDWRLPGSAAYIDAGNRFLLEFIFNSGGGYFSGNVTMTNLSANVQTVQGLFIPTSAGPVNCGTLTYNKTTETLHVNVVKSDLHLNDVITRISTM